MKQVGLIVVVMASACVVDDSNEVPETSEVEQHQDRDVCPPIDCTNSPDVIKYGLHEANLFGVADRHRYFLDRAGRQRVQIWDAGGKPWDLHIQNNRLFGVSHDGFWQLSGPSLKGAHLRVRRYGWFGLSSEIYRIIVDNVRETRFPVGNNDLLEVYRFAWWAPGGFGGKNVCNGPYPQDSKRFEELLNMNPDETLIFAGDRIDPDKMTMSEQPDYAWFNFGCAGHTLAKLHLTRNTITSQTPLDWSRRQATLKMFVADYCGNGSPITLPGTPLRWQSAGKPYYPTPQQIEARWNKGGAACLATPRLGYQSDYFGDVLSAIQNSCGGTSPPPCTNDDMYDLDGQLLVSAIPVPE